MKIYRYLIITTFIITLASCHKLDLNPLSDPATGNFFSNEAELTIAVNDLYRSPFILNDLGEYTDDYLRRSRLGNDVISGTMSSDNSLVLTYWTDCYRVIARANTILSSLDKAKANTPANVINSINAQAKFARGYQYSKLITHFGDVPFITEAISLEESYKLKRTDKTIILKQIYDDLDFAAQNLPATYQSGSLQRWTKGVALAVKARTALYLGDYNNAMLASKAVIDLAQQGVYALYPSFRDLFLAPGETSKEVILSVIQSQANDVFDGKAYAQDFISRNAGGFGSRLPTWDLMDSYECRDGLTIDRSPLYNPKKPFDNRDPRLAQTIVPFSTNWLGYSYQPHPDSLKVKSWKTGGNLVSNKDTRAVATFASYTGFLFKKGIDQSWADNLANEYDRIIIRYAEMLLTYAEAKIELNSIDASVLDAINQLRARAYGVNVNQIALYPAIKTTDQAELRKIVRRERRVEFANEGIRYMDLIRWRTAEIIFNRPMVGLPDPAQQDRSKWPFPGTPNIDSNGFADYSPFLSDIKILVNRNFDKNKQYLWPIPSAERLINPNLTQNPNY